ncbi:hypothetical protein FKP32DRAFT_1762205 [Trametes sanguinea]|nr:hypothetical protein FKP32DRAFT_1762205 [Trametes sanguinea]
MDGQLKPKVTARMDYSRPRPASPFKPPTAVLSPSMVKPKAKVNSSANIQTRKTPTVVSPPPSARGSAIPTRSPSPFKPTQTRNTNTTPNAAVKARLTARTNGANSTSPLPESRQRALTAGPSEPPSYVRSRRGSTSSHLLSSPSHTELSTASSPARSALSLQTEETSSSVSASPRSAVNVRVKAKISKVAEPGVLSPPTLPSSAHHVNRPARVPSISNLSLSPPLMPSSANHSPSSATSSPLGQQRFATTKETRPHSYQPPKSYQAFTPNDDSAVNYSSGYTPTAKVDPSTIPLPPQSPPVSTVSFSSRSSASRSSASYGSQESGNSRSTAPTLHSNVNGHGHERQGSRSSQARASIDGLGIRSAPVTREPSSTSDAEYQDDYDSDPQPAAAHEEDSERKRKAQAKSNRKIADLEITNRSLLAINSSLEATKHKQAREIRELRRKLRESRLILPPPAYRAVKSSLPHDDEETDEEEEDDEDDADIIEGKDDEPYRRVKVMVEGLIESCKRALESKPEDFVGTSRGVAKVLTEEEVRNWRGDDNDTETRSTLDPDDTSFSGSRPLTPSRVAVPSSDSDLDSEDEVEASLLEPDVEPLSPLPPITITPSASP